MTAKRQQRLETSVGETKVILTCKYKAPGEGLLAVCNAGLPSHIALFGPMRIAWISFRL